MKNNLTSLFLLAILLLTGCKPGLETIKDVLPVDRDTAFYFIHKINNNNQLFRYDIKKDKLVEYNIPDSSWVTSIFPVNDGQLIRYGSNKSGNNVGYFNQDGSVSYLAKLKYPYYSWAFSPDHQGVWGCSDPNQFKWGMPTMVQIDKLDSNYEFSTTYFSQIDFFTGFRGFTTDNEYLLFEMMGMGDNGENDYRAVAVSVKLPPKITDLRPKHLIENDGKSWMGYYDWFIVNPSKYADSVYVTNDWGKSGIFMFSASTGQWREIASLGVNEQDYFRIDEIVDFKKLPYTVVVVEFDVILIRNTETGKVIKIEPDRKPDEVIPMRIVNPE